MQQALWWLDKLDATVGRAEALISRKSWPPRRWTPPPAVRRAWASWRSCSPLLAQLEPSADEPEPTWLLENGELPENMALTAANLNVSAATLLKQLTAVQDALVEARRDKNEDSGQIDQLGSELGFLLPAPRRWRRCGR